MKIVVLDGFTLNPGDLTWDTLHALGDVLIYDRTSPEEILERSLDAEILLTNKTPLRAEVISQLKSLKYIGVLATGYNIVDIEAAKNQGIFVSNVPAYSTDSVVQLTFALILELTLHVQKHSDAVREGKWANSKDFCFWDFPLIELAGKTIGIIGFGTIGQKVADVATAFGMKVIANSRRPTDQSHRKNFKWESISTLLEESDFVSIHCPLTAETQSLMNRENLQKMKSSAFLINTSRGPIIVDEDLAEALNNNTIAGAGIDVLSVEPPQKNNPLFTAQNCIITPHIAWATKEARTRLLAIALENISAYQSGNPKNVVNS
ncbi:D-2-hydroxyacid dehydrogenase [Arcicella lustrica]|uniref:D-2-hydroxyacid dehydrogenase n=1 Tax=Arcicella lustrica TaxID=2984196 RepID=A0ABU5SH95_9BACT|nr:D-2-hydroxyacid dehydrogenase [Arcicella sp. DC25W]MEA5426667.1 D-2-hydroxyacid dehydrogenase [Arcicella sp. DC25W]